MKLSTLTIRCFGFLLFFGFLCGPVYAQVNSGESLSLQEALELAYQRNPRMIEARNAIVSARGKRITESTFADPEVEFEIGGLKKESGERDTGLKKFGVRQEFDSPGVLWMKSRIAKNDVFSEEEALKEVWSRIYSQVRDAYYTVLLEEKESEVAGDNLKVLRQFLDRVTVRFQSGEVLRNDLQRAKIEVLDGENSLLVAQKKLRTEKAALNLLIGQDIRVEYVLVESPRYEELKGSFEQLLDTAIHSRPDVKRAEIFLDSMEKSLTKEKLSVLPAPFVAFERSMEDYDDDYKILLGFSIPFWNWNIGKMKSSRADRETAESNLQALKRDVSYEVHNAFLDTQLANKQFSIAKKAITEANELLRLADLRYGEGKMSYLDYIDQVRTVMESRLRYHRSLFEFNRMVTKLEQVTYSSLRDEDYLK
ncbi:MAG: TolC family protein [Candidatus Tritonobacter lacicola]|nr:TolC family protein [Candidatus Tritonobacter lacicola]